MTGHHSWNELMSRRYSGEERSRIRADARKMLRRTTGAAAARRVEPPLEEEDEKHAKGQERELSARPVVRR